MKKLFLLLLFPILSYAEPTTTETERIIDKYGEKIAIAFEEAIDTATPIAKEGYQIAIKLQVVKGIAELLPLVFTIILWFLFNKEYKKVESFEYNGTPWLYFTFVSAIITSLIALFSTYTAVLRLMAPEWYAIKDILDLI